ncbi:MAG: hypothetical protein JXA71_05970 [Chitinispirillaceae bacterium]|nr:hypothetical protein [Chitinispirillaceae bacterium]
MNRAHTHRKAPVLLLLVCSLCTSVFGQLPAFPTAEGFGRNAQGGRGGDVYHVTTLSDAGSGSLRDGIGSASGPRTIVFDVGGWITLASDLGVTHDYVTLAGQTAPGQGIGIRGMKFSIGASNVIARFLRVRKGDITSATDRDDAMTVSSSSDNVIIDHCSIMFGTDETLSLPGDEGTGPSNFTVQWSIIAWGVQRNNHSAGSLLCASGTTIHHTLWAFNKTRNPRARSENGAVLDWVNNVIYGWNARDPVGEEQGWSLSYDPFIMAGTENGSHAANVVGNYFISSRSANYALHKGTSNFRLHFQNNLLDGNADGRLNSSKTGIDMIEGTPTMSSTRLTAPQVKTDAPLEAYNKVMSRAGAIKPRRDQVDSLCVWRVQNQTGNLIQTEADLAAAGIGASGYGVLANATRPANFDTDRDGMPDAWETSHSLNPSNAADRNGITLSKDGYTNLEVYLNELAGDSLPDVSTDRDREFTGNGASVNTKYALNLTGSAIELTAPVAATVTVDALDLKGRRIASLFQGPVTGGRTVLETTGNAFELPAGVGLLSLHSSDGTVLVRKVVANAGW